MTLQETDLRFVILLCARALGHSGQPASYRNIRSMIRLLQRGYLYMETWKDEEGTEMIGIQINPSVVECVQNRVLH